MKIPRFYPILDTGTLTRSGFHPLDTARQILDAGARILQFRHKTFYSRQTVDLLFALAEATRRAGAMFVVNDRADFAKLASAALHLGQDDLPPEAARRIVGPETIVGF
jgi:thiamine-phosphate pyrophosphorylase